jgi:hypothetical protein
MPYGSILGGYGALFEDMSGSLDLAIRVLLVTCVALPAILPPLALLGWGWLLWRGKVSGDQRPVVILFLLAGAALVLALSPRPDVMHLAFVVALPYILFAAAFSRLVPAGVRIPSGIVAVMLAVIFSLHSFTGLAAMTSVPSPVGTLRVEQVQRGVKLLAVHPGDHSSCIPTCRCTTF